MKSLDVSSNRYNIRLFEYSGIKLFLFILVLAAIGPSSPAHAFLRAKGDKIVDENGEPVILRGYGLGGWLVPEGYMLQIPGFGSPTDIRQKIVALIGEQNADDFYRRYEANYVNEKDIELIANWGFNSIRLPFHYRPLYDPENPDSLAASGLEHLDNTLSWCKKYGLYLILDMHAAPGGQNSGNISDSDGIEARLWTNPENQEITRRIWKNLARRYVDEEMIAGYDLINEPVLSSGYSTVDFRLFYMDLAREIRKIDTNHIIFIEGNWYATDFRSLTPPFDVNMAYSYHMYWSAVNTTRIQSYLDMRRLHKVPLWLGETGENSNPWFHANIQLHEKYHIGWNWWTHKKVGTITSPLSAKFPQGYQELIDYWNGTAARPSADAARQILFQLADNLAVENCNVRYDVIDAMTRPDFNSRGIPFKEHQIPGTIAAVDYDMGDNGVAYFDRDYENTGGTSWNKGWAYRNDGVDIERSDDPLGPEYSVGWVEDGEWLNYTVDVLQEGSYEFRLRFASQEGSGQFRLYSDSTPVSDMISVPASGGWKNWTELTVSNLKLVEGIQTLQVRIAKGGFNISSFGFTLTNQGGGVALGKNAVVEQNYPNPFQKRTTLPVTILKTTNVTINVCDISGRRVRALINSNLEAGRHEVVWDGTDDNGVAVSSGIYFFEVKSGDERLIQRTLFIK